MNTGWINWYSGSIRLYESPASLCVKLGVLNSTKAVEYRSLFEQNSLDELAVMLREPLHVLETVLKKPQSLAFCRNVIGLRKTEGLWPPDLRICPTCIQEYFHSWLHQEVWLANCPWHDVELKRVRRRSYSPTATLAQIRSLSLLWTGPGEAVAKIKLALGSRARHLTGASNRRAAEILKNLNTIESNLARFPKLRFESESLSMAMRSLAEYSIRNSSDTNKTDEFSNELFIRLLPVGKRIQTFSAAIANYMVFDRLMLKSIFDPIVVDLIKGHESCVEEMHRHYERWELSVCVRMLGKKGYLAFFLQSLGHPICPRLVTLDMFSRLLSPTFLRTRVSSLECVRGSGSRAEWAHLAWGSANPFLNGEWDDYDFSDQAYPPNLSEEVLPWLRQELDQLVQLALVRELRSRTCQSGDDSECAQRAIDDEILHLMQSPLVAHFSHEKGEQILKGTVLSHAAIRKTPWSAIQIASPDHDESTRTVVASFVAYVERGDAEIRKTLPRGGKAGGVRGSSPSK